MNNRIKTLDDVEILDPATNKKALKEMGLHNIMIWEDQLPEGAFKGIEHDHREGRDVATFDFEKVEESDDPDRYSSLTGMISMTVTYFGITKEDYEIYKQQGDLDGR